MIFSNVIGCPYAKTKSACGKLSNQNNILGCCSDVLIVDFEQVFLRLANSENHSHGKWGKFPEAAFRDVL